MKALLAFARVDRRAQIAERSLTSLTHSLHLG